MWKTEFLITLIVFNLFFLAFAAAVIVYIKQYKSKKKENTMRLTAQFDEHQKELLSTQIEIQTQTMQYIGREIHDNIGQQLTLASLYMQQLARKNKTTPLGDNIANISIIINKSLTDLRTLSKNLTDDTIKSKNIVYLLKQECEKINSLQTCTVFFNCEHEKVELSYEVKTVLVRILQEFIQNSLKHADCKNIVVSLMANDKKIAFNLKDDGIGFNPKSKNFKGIGLKNTKKRIEILKGKFKLTSVVNLGTSFEIEIPLS